MPITDVSTSLSSQAQYLTDTETLGYLSGGLFGLILSQKLFEAEGKNTWDRIDNNKLARFTFESEMNNRPFTDVDLCDAIRQLTNGAVDISLQEIPQKELLTGQFSREYKQYVLGISKAFSIAYIDNNRDWQFYRKEDIPKEQQIWFDAQKTAVEGLIRPLLEQLKEGQEGKAITNQKEW